MTKSAILPPAKRRISWCSNRVSVPCKNYGLGTAKRWPMTAMCSAPLSTASRSISAMRRRWPDGHAGYRRQSARSARTHHGKYSPGSHCRVQREGFSGRDHPEHRAAGGHEENPAALLHRRKRGVIRGVAAKGPEGVGRYYPVRPDAERTGGGA